MRLLLGVSIGAGGDRAGFWSKQSVWILDGDGKLTLFCGLIVTASGYGRRASGSVLGLGPVIWCCVVRSQYEVGPSLEYGDGVVDDRSGL